MRRYLPGPREARRSERRTRRRRFRAIGLVLVGALVSSSCSLGGGDDEWVGPEEAVLRFERPRREAMAVDERWVLVREHDQSFLLHAFDVERRRVKQRCGTIRPETFATGWDELVAAGLLNPGDDLRFAPRPGEPPFVGRLQVSFLYQGRQVEARRPLIASQGRALERVLHNWEKALRVEEPQTLPALMRVETRLGGCNMQRASDDVFTEPK